MGDEIKPEVIQATQKLLGRYVKKPPLTEKLLRKPPFRFLHDIVTTVIRETGFLKGLFNETELNSENVKERNAKLAFLNKLIEATRTITKKDLKVRASKVIAGLEPTETNLLLQAIGKAIDQKLDSTKYVAQVNGRRKKETPTKNIVDDKKTRKTSETEDKKSSRSNESTNVKGSKSKKITTPKKKKETISPKSEEQNPKEEIKDVILQKAEEKKETEEDLITQENTKNDNRVSDLDEGDVTVSELKSEEKIETEQPSIRRSAQRPKSARPRSGNKENEVKLAEENLLITNNDSQNKPEVHQLENFLRPPSVRPSSARPGAPRLRPDSAIPLKEVVPMGKINVIVENFSNKEDEEETVVIQTEEHLTEEVNLSQQIDVIGDKGQLVEQILEQINNTEDEHKSGSLKTSIEWDESNISKVKDGVTKEIEPLRHLVQTLTKTANPLGKLVSYLNEDIESMYNELNMWKEMKRHNMEAIAKEKRLKEDLCKPLYHQLQEVENNIKKQEEEIVHLRSKISHNDMLIKQMISDD